MGVIDPQAAERVGWMLIHSLWQGAIIALALAVALRLLRRSTAQARYVVACLALVALVIAPVATLWHLSRDGNDTSAAGVLLLPHSLVQTERLSPAYALFGHEGVSGGRTWIHLVNDVVETLRPVLTWVVIVWFAGAAIVAVRQVGGWVLLRRLLSGNASPLDDESARFEAIARRVGLHRRVRFFETALVDVPATLGWLRPLVLLPASALAGMDVRYVDALVAHELAHVRRHDYLVNLLQAIAETMLFYHPAAWWISRRVRDEREQCCDDLAVAATGDAVTYARALATMEQVRPSWGAYA
ncbi:MAG: M56 family metallopeptidase, partial [Tepidisphaeraceae bacterium]